MAPRFNIKSSIFSGMEYLIGGDATTYHMHMERDINFGRGEKISFPVNYLSRNKNIGLGKKYLSVSKSLLF